MQWNLDFISARDFQEHVKHTIESYGEKLRPIDLKRFNANIIDPVKMAFDKEIYNQTWEQLVTHELFRQRDKSNANEIGYFHQNIFRYMKNCTVPHVGEQGGWDVIYNVPNGDKRVGVSGVSRVYVEMKNKHNTMNSSAAVKTYIKMQNQLLQENTCACFLVEVIAKQSQNVCWETSVDGAHVKNERIRRVSIDKFYEVVTGETDAFLQVCLVLPSVIKEILSNRSQTCETVYDSAYDEIVNMLADLKEKNCTFDYGMQLAMYLLGFSTYNGFQNLSRTE